MVSEWQGVVLNEADIEGGGKVGSRICARRGPPESGMISSGI